MVIARLEPDKDREKILECKAKSWQLGKEKGQCRELTEDTGVNRLACSQG